MTSPRTRHDRAWTDAGMTGTGMAGQLKRRAVQLAHAMPFVRAAAQPPAADAAQADASEISKAEFLATMSHEMRTPLNAIIGFSEIMSTELFGPLGNEGYRGYVDDIHDSARNLLILLDNVLDMAALRDGRLSLDEETVDVDDVVEEAMRLARGEAERTGVVLRRGPSARGAPTLLCDRARLRQLLLNLLSNAVKFNRAGGTVSVGIAAEHELTITIADTGRGIADDELPRVLAPFARIDAATSRTAAGAGLGLPLARALAERHGGRLDIESAPDRGTTVTVTFPAWRAARDVAEFLETARPAYR